MPETTPLIKAALNLRVGAGFDVYGSPTDINNKTAIQSQVHRRYVTPWWNKIRDEVKKGLN